LNLSRSYKKFGLQIKENGDIEFLEWAPAASKMTIFGDFNNWNRDEFVCEKNEYGQFLITLKADEDGTPKIKHLQQYKISITGPDGSTKDKNSAWAPYQIQDKNTNLFNCVLWNPNEKFQWKNKRPI